MAAHAQGYVPFAGKSAVKEEEEEEALPPAVFQGWLFAREPGLRKYWHNRWAVVRRGSLDIYEDPAADERCALYSVPLHECRIERMAVQDGHLQRGCDYEFAWRVVVPSKLGVGVGKRIFAVQSEQERNDWGAALIASRTAKLQGRQ